MFMLTVVNINMLFTLTTVAMASRPVICQ